MAARRHSSVVEVDRTNDGVARVNDASLRRLSANNADMNEIAEAKAATNKEHELTVRDALKLYPKAIAFSIVFSSAVIMEGRCLLPQKGLY
jgi:MFS transporter, SP family, general alpha glucoside:H+ symporter